MRKTNYLCSKKMYASRVTVLQSVTSATKFPFAEKYFIRPEEPALVDTSGRMSPGSLGTVPGYRPHRTNGKTIVKVKTLSRIIVIYRGASDSFSGFSDIAFVAAYYRCLWRFIAGCTARST